MATPIHIIATVDSSKPLVSNGTLNVPLNEALTITDADYIKFKKEALDKNPKLAERQKDDQFQQAFKELWPHTYSRINDREMSSVAAVEELNRQKALYNSMLYHDINCCKASWATYTSPKTFMCKDCHQVTYLGTNQVSSACCNGCSAKTYTCCNPATHVYTHTVERITPIPTPLPKPTFQSTDLSYAKLPELVSSYNFPYFTSKEKEDLVKSSYNKDKISEDVKLLTSIKDNNEKLKLQNKIEKTNDLVDDIITKVSVLQADLKKKTAEMKIKEDMLKLKEDYVRLRREPSLKSILKTRSRSKSPCCHRSSSAERRPKTPSSSSSLGHHHHHYYDSKYTKTSSSSSDYDSDGYKRTRFWNSWKDVPPRVDSWNCDWNIY